MGTTCPGTGLEDDMRVLDFAKQEWTLLSFPTKPRCCEGVFLGTFGNYLIQFGGQPSLPSLLLLFLYVCLLEDATLAC